MNLDFTYFKKKTKEKILAYDVNFFKLFALIKKNFSSAYLFESLSIPRNQNRFYTLGFDADAIFKAKGKTLTIKGKEDIIEKITKIKGKTSLNISHPNPYQLIQKSFPKNFSCQSNRGGLIGYLSYEAVNYFEPSITLPEPKNFSLFQFGLFTDGLIYDTSTNTLSYYYFDKDKSHRIKKFLAELNSFSIPRQLKSVHFQGHSESKKEFIQAVKKTKEKICNGYSFQAEVGFKSHYKIVGDKLAIYQRLREINPSPYMYYVKFGQEELLGSSPEILASNHDGMILTTPTAGTIERGKTPKEDIELARQLLNDPKEIAEHNMLVDLHRNDLARIAKVGSVKVNDLMYIIKFSHVQHIVSNVIGLMRDDKDSFDLLASIMPGGVVSGAPKIETIKIIASNESSPRGVYGGAIGRFNFNGDCDFCLPLRSIFCFKDECYAQTSAGIVYDSIPEKEFAEVNNKLAAMKQTLEELGGETYA